MVLGRCDGGGGVRGGGGHDGGSADCGSGGGGGVDGCVGGYLGDVGMSSRVQ